MKLAIALIIIGIALLVDGAIRISMGVTTDAAGLIIGGILTGILLGGYLIYRGVKRWQQQKK
jgi:hypothetical protein